MTVSKAQLRQHFRALRDAMTPQEVAACSALIEARVLALPQVEQARTFFIYVSIVNEVRTMGLIQAVLDRGCVVSVPLIEKRGVMHAHRITSVADLVPGRYDIPSPDTTDRHDGPVDVCIAPGLAFTESGQRLGAGGGYYDRYLARHRAKWTIGLAYETQLAAHLPTVATDQAVDLIVTEKRVISPAAEKMA